MIEIGHLGAGGLTVKGLNNSTFNSFFVILSSWFFINYRLH